MFDLTQLSVRGHYEASYKTAQEPDIWPWLAGRGVRERSGWKNWAQSIPNIKIARTFCLVNGGSEIALNAQYCKTTGKFPWLMLTENFLYEKDLVENFPSLFTSPPWKITWRKRNILIDNICYPQKGGSGVGFHKTSENISLCWGFCMKILYIHIINKIIT